MADELQMAGAYNTDQDAAGPARTQYQPNSNNNHNNGAAYMNRNLDLERLNTISTLLGPDAGSLSVEPHKRFRDFGNPSPLGLSAFALTTMVLSLVNAHARHVTEPNIVIGLALFYGGLVQLLAGMWEFAVGNTFGATALSSYGGFWLSFAVIFIPFFNIQAGYATSSFTDALAIYLICWFLFTTLLLICTLKSTVAFFLLFFTLDLAFLMLAIGYFRAATKDFVPLVKAGGYFGIFAAVLAWYNALAGVVEKHNSFFSIPVLPLPWSEVGRAGRRASSEQSRDHKA